MITGSMFVVDEKVIISLVRDGAATTRDLGRRVGVRRQTLLRALRLLQALEIVTRTVVKAVARDGPLRPQGYYSMVKRLWEPALRLREPGCRNSTQGQMQKNKPTQRRKMT